MASLKDMRVRIAATKATQKITKAMQMVAASKLRRAQAAAEAARPYAERMDKVLGNIAAAVRAVADLPRATAFYAEVLQIDLRPERFQDRPMAIFPYAAAQHAVGGALVHDPRQRPSTAGVVVYLNAGTDIRGAVDRTVKAGGLVTMPVTDIGAPGFIALIQDPEGNVVGLHEARLPQPA